MANHNSSAPGGTALFRKKFNGPITKQVIQLHQVGYIYDFIIFRESEMICIQNGKQHLLWCSVIVLVDLCRNQTTGKYSYIHTVETSSGEKGILLSDHYYTSFPIPLIDIESYTGLTLAKP